MVARQIGEHRNLEGDAKNALLGKRMGRHFHHRFRGTTVQRIPE